MRTRYGGFEVDNTLVSKHKPTLMEHDKNIKGMLEEGQKCGWQTLFTHPKLMRSYYHKDYRIHSRDQRIAEIK